MARLFLAVAVFLEYVTGVAGIGMGSVPIDMIQKHIRGSIVIGEVPNYDKTSCETKKVERENNLLAALKTTSAKDDVYASFIDDSCNQKEVTLDVTFPKVVAITAMTLTVPDDVGCSWLMGKIVKEMKTKKIDYSLASFKINDEDCEDFQEELHVFGRKLTNEHKITVEVIQDVSVTVTHKGSSVTNKIKSKIGNFWLRFQFSQWLQLPSGEVVDTIKDEAGNTITDDMVTVKASDAFTVATKTGTALEYKDESGANVERVVPGFLEADISQDWFKDNLMSALCMLNPGLEFVVKNIAAPANPIRVWIGEVDHYKRTLNFAVAALPGPLKGTKDKLNTGASNIITHLEGNLAGFVQLEDAEDGDKFDLYNFVSSCAINQINDFELQAGGEVHSYPIQNTPTQGCFKKQKECCSCEVLASTSTYCVEPSANACTAFSDEAPCSPAVQCDASCVQSDGDEDGWFIDNCTSDYQKDGKCDEDSCDTAADHCPDTKTVSHVVLYAMKSDKKAMMVTTELLTAGGKQNLKVDLGEKGPGSYTMLLTVFYNLEHHARLPNHFYRTHRTQHYKVEVLAPPDVQVEIIGVSKAKQDCGASLTAETKHVPEGTVVWYDWSCDREDCTNLVKDMKSNTITITGLAVGKYAISVNVNKKTDDIAKTLATAKQDLEIQTEVVGKILDLPMVPDEIPIQHTYKIPPLPDVAGCTLGFEAWYLVPADDSAVITLVEPAATINYRVNVDIDPSKVDVAKTYRLRVTYGSTATTALDGTMYGETNAFKFANNPPTGGSLVIKNHNANTGFTKINVIVSSWKINNAACENKPLRVKIQTRKTDNEEWIDVSGGYKNYISGEMNSYDLYQGGALKFRSVVEDCFMQIAEVSADFTVTAVDYTAVTVDQMTKQFDDAQDDDAKMDLAEKLAVGYAGSDQKNVEVLEELVDTLTTLSTSVKKDSDAYAEPIIDALVALSDANGSNGDILVKIVGAAVDVAAIVPFAKYAEFAAGVVEDNGEGFLSKLGEGLTAAQQKELTDLTVSNQPKQVITPNTQSAWIRSTLAKVQLNSEFQVNQVTRRAVADSTEFAVTKFTSFKPSDETFKTDNYNDCKSDDGNLLRVQSSGDVSLVAKTTRVEPAAGKKVVMMKIVSDKRVEAGCEIKSVSGKQTITCPINKGQHTMNTAVCTVNRSFDSGADRTAASFVISTAIVMIAAALTQ